LKLPCARDNSIGVGALAAQSDYCSAFRFVDVVTHVKRARESLTELISAIPGVLITDLILERENPPYQSSGVARCQRRVA
jgi:hypothetical protein